MLVGESHHEASTTPVPTHQPEIAAIVGLGETSRGRMTVPWLLSTSQPLMMRGRLRTG